MAFELIAQVRPKRGAIHIEGVVDILAIVGERLHTRLIHVFGAGQIGHEIAAGSESVGHVIHCLPSTTRSPPVGLVAFDAYFDTVAGVEDATAILPQGHLHGAVGQVRLALDVQCVLPAAAAHVGDPRGGVGGLHDVRGEVVYAGLLSATPGSLDLVGGGRLHGGNGYLITYFFPVRKHRMSGDCGIGCLRGRGYGRRVQARPVVCGHDHPLHQRLAPCVDGQPQGRQDQ